MDSAAYEAGVRAALDGLFWYENPTGSKDWLDGHDSITQAMKRGAWFAADVDAKRAARMINEEKTK